ncbi:DUF6801 domain-containing protein [Amycolatopsis anabasis]|uniref:DUF6801 domain-containing protein n=1 Tax=Amycolatopsis anabasis TaxID=1840409 RepID=UPI00131C7A1D|nr:DUF6801 domain-containing protein [Amycolatopsis anabasis]
MSVQTRRATRACAVTAALALAGVSLSASPAAAGPASRTITSTCAFGQGPAPVPFGVAAVFPESTPAGTPLQPKDFAVTPVLSDQLVKSLRSAGVTTFEGSVAPVLTVHSQGSAKDIALQPIAVPLTALPDSGEFRLPLKATVPPVTVGGSGAVTFDVSRMTAQLKTHAIRDNALVADDVSCASGPGQGGTLASVPLSGDPNAPRTSGSDPISVTSGETSAAPSIQAAVAGFPPRQGLKYGFWVDETSTTIQKLGSKIQFGRGQFDSVIKVMSPPADMWGNLTLPPASGYFVTFNFVPVTSTAELIQDGEATGKVTVNPSAKTATVKELTLRAFTKLGDVKVDGVPLDVGPNCRTASPVIVRPKDTTVNLVPGSPPATVEADFEIPPFAGCGVTENLDRLFTGMVSGPGNKMTAKLSVRCSPLGPRCE